jgi:imidazole glycerol-phosphate synthase subunit HisH
MDGGPDEALEPTLEPNVAAIATNTPSERLWRQRADVLEWRDYGYRFASAARNRNVCATQFYPEKSRKYGLQLFRNFVERH